MLKNAIIGATTLAVVMLATPARAQAQSQQSPCASARDKVQCELNQTLNKLEAMRRAAAQRDAERQRIAAQAAEQRRQQQTKTAAATGKASPATKGKQPGSACKTYPVCEAR